MTTNGNNDRSDRSFGCIRSVSSDTIENSFWYLGAY